MSDVTCKVESIVTERLSMRARDLNAEIVRLRQTLQMVQARELDALAVHEETKAERMAVESRLSKLLENPVKKQRTEPAGNDVGVSAASCPEPALEPISDVASPKASESAQSQPMPEPKVPPSAGQ